MFKDKNYNWNAWTNTEALTEVKSKKYIECNGYIFPVLFNKLITEGYTVTGKQNPNNRIHYAIRITK